MSFAPFVADGSSSIQALSVGTGISHYPSSRTYQYDASFDSIPRFSHTSATPLNEVHPSGWKVAIILDREGRSDTGPGRCWRSGEVVRGVVQVERADIPGQEGPFERKKVISVILRAFWQSTTQFQTQRLLEPKQPTGVLGKLQPAAVNLRSVTETRAEWHRGYCLDGGEGTEVWNGGELEDISRQVEGDFPLLEGLRNGGSDSEMPPPIVTPTITRPDEHSNEADQTTLPFSFGLPTTTLVTYANAVPNPPASRRLTQNYVRTPPASLSSQASRNGTVEWVVEALVRVASPETIAEVQAQEAAGVGAGGEEDLPPAFANTISFSSPDYPTRYGHLTSTPDLIVRRVVFPFEPSDHHSQDLLSSWRPELEGPWVSVVAGHNGLTIDEIRDERPVTTPVVPCIGRDARDEALGGTYVGPARPLRGQLIEREGGREKWSTFEKRMPIRNVFGKLSGYICCQLSTPRPSSISRHAATIPMLFNLSYTLPEGASAKAVAKSKAMYIDKVVVMLTARILTRGGNDDRPKFYIEELRREERKLWEDSAEDAPADGGRLRMIKTTAHGVDRGRTQLCLKPGEAGREVKLEIDLQSEGESVMGRPLVPVRQCTVSFRTPNVEVEYVLSATIHAVGQDPFFCVRTPIQLLAGDLDELPQAHTGVPPVLPGELPPPLDHSNGGPPSPRADGLPGYEEV
ncbi:hypothetical protein T439DRAFT_381107 [Meredithblackwellia eburnea MCA 4105]